MFEKICDSFAPPEFRNAFKMSELRDYDAERVLRSKYFLLYDKFLFNTGFLIKEKYHWMTPGLKKDWCQ